MILGTVLKELERRDLNTALVTLCIGAGIGAATLASVILGLVPRIYRRQMVETGATMTEYGICHARKQPRYLGQGDPDCHFAATRFAEMEAAAAGEIEGRASYDAA